MTDLESQADPATVSMNQFLLQQLDEYWKNYRSELKRCRTEFSNEAVHDLRASARRMLAFLQLLNAISPKPRTQKLSHAFKDQLDQFDELRDTQVILADISETLQELPQLHVFYEYLQGIEKELLKTLRKKLKVIDLFDVSKGMRRMRESLKTETNDNLLLPILQAVDDAFLNTRQRRNWINPTAASSIHRVRIAFKAFRYMVEIIYPLLPDFPPETLERMHEYQSRMGEIQDAEVIMQALAEAPVGVASFDPEPVRGYYEGCHASAIAAYLKSANELDTFWRLSPDQPFPWEK